MLVALKPFGEADWEQAALAHLADVRHVVCSCEAELIVNAHDADLLLTDTDTPVSADVLNSAERLQAVICLSTGVDYVDVQAATDRNVLVTNLPDYAVQAVAEHTFALLFALLRHVVQGDRIVRQDNWAQRSRLSGVECAGKVLGIIGTGRIGQRVRRLGEALGMHVVVFSPNARLDPSCNLCDSLADLLRVADVVSIHTSLGPATRGLLGKEEFGWMKPEALLINTSRGPIVDESALINALQTSQIAGAALDVFEAEPPSPENPLLRLENVVLSPHVAWFTREARQRARETIYAQVAAISRGELPPNMVNPSAAAGWLQLRAHHAPS